MPILIAGPTASGKSALAMALAARLGGVVINADSMQVYGDLAILTARPSPADEARVPHALYGHVDAATAHSVAAFLSDVAGALAAARERGQRPVIVGGTGLYLAALTEGLSPTPQVPADVRALWRQRQKEAPSEALHAELARRDPPMAARLNPGDPQRIVRALEVVDGTGRSLLEFQAEKSPPLVDPAASTRIVLAPDRTVLRARIAARFEAMMASGALAEAATLAARGLDPALPSMKAIGVAPLIAHAAGALTAEEVMARAITESRQYAKRQDTWFRNRFRDWPRYESADAAADQAI
ncbi:tRNA (adenosine(37)-N6)-dimethylallyltransferase MiaA [Acuticoccus sp. MNP-M23]|uniref:tRNA (adenosine(37)-N6)-dimethylallyltransferase MiaA n=1 Tax=Acuticoccus sp. MNP-M23 TaxID=3072793 RepID=UPI0028157B5D|nr:tRNA (adenosine(37)-N6)-dimethylallyltransferase MiaA [Acuticoccus sp. MNP-M23]WMS41623.1 tRNA (adenosine(37)-N6)-dimethylallyltransferase MiaA [Acuticoccus sp. MNP-M23]